MAYGRSFGQSRLERELQVVAVPRHARAILLHVFTQVEAEFDRARLLVVEAVPDGPHLLAKRPALRRGVSKHGGELVEEVDASIVGLDLVRGEQPLVRGDAVLQRSRRRPSTRFATE